MSLRTAPWAARNDKSREGSERIGWDGILFLCLSVLTLFARFRSQALLLGSYQDDFFYYLQVAKYIATTGVSTFNGLYLTNGYHPLWMAVLVLLYRVFHGTVFFLVLQAVSALCAFATYLLMGRTLRLFLPAHVARPAALVLGLEALMLIRYGMEVTLTLPLAALLVYRLARRGIPSSFASAALLGLLGSLVVLSRLDAALLVVLLCAAALLPRLRSGVPWVAVGGFLCGALPLLVLYLGWNEHVFHVLTPVSGLAKQMKTSHGFSSETWRSLLPTDRMRRWILLPEVVLVLAGTVAACLPTVRRSSLWRMPSAGLLPALLLFPLVHLSVLSLLSDWNVWPWYFYSVTLAALPGVVLLSAAVPLRPLRAALWMYAGVLCVYAAVYAWEGPSSVTVYQSSLQLARYMDAHPGVYLMGDQAGTTAYLSHQPIVQTEGLVMDRHFLQLMRAATPLPAVAREYHASYYAKIGGTYDGPCLSLAEPANAGSDSPRMRGELCHEPLAVFYREADNMPIRVFRAAWLSDAEPSRQP